MLDLILSTVGQGLQWSVLALGVFLTFRILDIADLSVEGSFPLGAAVAATAITAGLGLPAAFVLALVAGSLAGGVTGLLTTKLRIPALLAGILTMIGLYSVNLHVMGKSNVGLLQNETVFTILENSLGLSVAMSGLVVGLVFAVAIAVVIYWFFGTELGTAVRATGFNPQMARAQGINTNTMVVLGLVISERPCRPLRRHRRSGQRLRRRRHGRGHDRDRPCLRHHRRGALLPQDVQDEPRRRDPRLHHLPTRHCIRA